ncbi:recombinase family protein [Glutamicibacter sp. NPDC087344]|uniref:recombinase family protein n=1 Tax=Glutamicibacter sp. NPDC087344 TaxID=3363994 RepID=UPI00382F3498
MGHLLGCVRVSTGDQDAQLQLDTLAAAGCYRNFTDTDSGALEFRPELDKLRASVAYGMHRTNNTSGFTDPSVQAQVQHRHAIVKIHWQN